MLKGVKRRETPIMNADSEISVTKCQRCKREVDKEKTPFVSTRKKTMYFCDNCFKAVFKYDETLKTLPMIFQETGGKVPFVVRSTNWHRSSYMIVREVREEEARGGKRKQVFMGDMYPSRRAEGAESTARKGELFQLGELERGTGAEVIKKTPNTSGGDPGMTPATGI